MRWMTQIVSGCFGVFNHQLYLKMLSASANLKADCKSWTVQERMNIAQAFLGKIATISRDEAGRFYVTDLIKFLETTTDRQGKPSLRPSWNNHRTQLEAAAENEYGPLDKDKPSAKNRMWAHPGTLLPFLMLVDGLGIVFSALRPPVCLKCNYDYLWLHSVKDKLCSSWLEATALRPMLQ